MRTSAENGPFGTLCFWPKTPPKKLMWVPCLASFPRKWGTSNFFAGGPKSGVLDGGQKVYADKVYVLFLSPKISPWLIWKSTGSAKFKDRVPEEPLPLSILSTYPSWAAPHTEERLL